MRAQFEFTEEAIQELDHLQSITGLQTRAELVRHALRFFQWAVEETVKNGAILLLEKNGKLREVVFPFWAPVAKPKPQEEKPDVRDEEVRPKAAAVGRR